MKTNEFLNQLMEELKDMPETDRNQMREYFEEMLCDAKENGIDDEETIEKLGTPAQVAVKMREEYSQVTKREQESPIVQNCSQESNVLQTIRVTATSVAVKVVIVPSDCVRVCYQPKPSIEEFYCEEIGGVYTVTQRYRAWGFFKFIGFNIWTNEMLIEVPESFRGDLEIETSNAKILIYGQTELRKLHAQTSNGRIEASRVTSGNMYLRTTNGPVRIEEIRAENLNIKSSNGKLELRDVLSKGRLEAVTSNGRILIEDIHGRDMNLKSSNGSITGVMEGRMQEYSIQSRTSNGSNNLPPRMELPGAPVFKVHTSNGRINIEFTGISRAR